MAPVDFVANCIVEFSRQYDATQKAQTFVLASPHLTPVNMLGKALESFGYAVTPKPYVQWREQLIEKLADNPIEPLLSFFHPESLSCDRECTTPNTKKFLEKTGLSCPTITETMVHRWLQFMVDEGHMKPAKPSSNAGVFVVNTAKSPESAAPP